MPRKWLLPALALPLLALVLGIVRAEWHLAHSSHWVLDITGYDPRDLLRGHYIQYRLALHETAGEPACSEKSGERCCLCLTATGTDTPPKVQRTTCERADSCDGALQTRYLSELQRYYIPEARADAWTERVRTAATDGKARLRIAVDPSGRPQIEALLVDGVPIENTR